MQPAISDDPQGGRDPPDYFRWIAHTLLWRNGFCTTERRLWIDRGSDERHRGTVCSRIGRAAAQSLGITLQCP